MFFGSEVMSPHSARATGIGYTLESLLGITENNLKLPDLGSVELKSQRKGVSNRVTMLPSTEELGS